MRIHAVVSVYPNSRSVDLADRGKARNLTLSFLLMLGLFLVFVKSALSNLFLIAASGIWLFSIYFTFWMYSQQLFNIRHRFERFAAMSLFVSGFLLAGIGLLFTFVLDGFEFPLMDTDLFPPYLLQYDRLLVTDLDYNGFLELERGDWIIFQYGFESSLGPVIAVSGEHVTLNDAGLRIDDVLIDTAAAELPLIDSQFDITVPPSAVLVWVVLYAELHVIADEHWRIPGQRMRFSGSPCWCVR